MPLRDVLRALRHALGLHPIDDERDPTSRSKRDGTDADMPATTTFADANG